MKKKVLLTVLCTLLSVSMIFHVAYASGAIKIVVNGKTVAADVAPRMINYRVMVPISFVSKALGADVTWDQKTQTVGVKSYGITPVDVWKEDGNLIQFDMAAINNTVQVFMAGMDQGLQDLIEKSVTSDLDVKKLAESHFSMGPTMFSTQIVDIRRLKVAQGKPSEFQVKVAVQTWTLDDITTLDHWDLTVVQSGVSNKMGYIVKKIGEGTSTKVAEHRVFPGFTYKIDPFSSK
ncbi:copper amine oxidase N-terminal domain-containing protein [Paenibacillus sp. PL91]|uniref:copper amine oxidase N-terminal domain-containing protein n=1 Tax=Paenibacillus sp. PL91 TaxID=2729538 RepID=UPI00145D4560|nr:copper amine oxidase N-terminal domain-containing protein [Paenibacillus sp. PL91]MBC9200905.1 copper amine oxidase N-terminal domain-containing protein [Paenibacillus sp. PL91]